MSRTSKIILLFFLVLVYGPVSAQGLPNSVEVDSDTLILNGEGTRKKLFIALYDAGLYLRSPSSDAQSIIDADSVMAIALHITSGLVTAEKMEKATREGFDNSTGGNISHIADEIEEFINVFRAGVSEDDVYELLYLPGSGVLVSKNSAEQALIPGLDFKKALFGIWLSKSPVQASLKNALLGQ